MVLAQSTVAPRVLKSHEDIVAWVDEYRATGLSPGAAFEAVSAAIERDGLAAAFMGAAGGAWLVSCVWRQKGRNVKRYLVGHRAPELQEADPDDGAVMGELRHDRTLLRSDAAVMDVRYYVGGEYVVLGDVDGVIAKAIVAQLCKLQLTYAWEIRFFSALVAALPEGQRVRDHYSEVELKRLRLRTRGEE